MSLRKNKIVKWVVRKIRRALGPLIIDPGTHIIEGTRIYKAIVRKREIAEDAIRAAYQRSSYYIPYKKMQRRLEKDFSRCIAFYLPQYHPFAENDEFWGKGFTEWTNVTKALPIFDGHYQPRLPDELGFYDIRLKEVIRKQIEIAKNYGVYGLCIHYYWFYGQPIMRRFLDTLLANPDLDIPFCLHWANEPWTLRWDGNVKKDVLLEQKHSPSDDIEFIKTIAPALKDTRYIKIDGRPLLIIYRPGLFPDIRATVSRWNDYCSKNGIGKLYLALMQTHFDRDIDPRSIDFDAAIEYPPLNVCIEDKKNETRSLYRGFQGAVHEYADLAIECLAQLPRPYTWFRGITPDWDCSPRRLHATIFKGSSPLLYQRWLERLFEYNKNNLPEHKQYIFINAWNEWAEGAYLEPDRKYGYGYLQATYNALHPSVQKIAIVAHLYYDEYTLDLVEYLTYVPYKFDLFISTKPSAVSRVKRILHQHLPDQNIDVRGIQNRGRDIAPLIVEFKDVYKHYDVVCFVHSKKKKYLENTCGWRRYLWKNLLGSSETIDAILNMFRVDDSLGVIFPEYPPPIRTIIGWAKNFDKATVIAKKMNISIKQDDPIDYPAGSMFWFRPKALQPLFDLNLTYENFEEGSERQVDGTLAHSIERLFLIVAKKQGFRWRKTMFSSWNDTRAEEHSLYGRKT